VIYALLFGSVAAVLGALGFVVWPFGWGGQAAALLLWWVSVSFGGVALAYGVVGPRLLGKRLDGAVPLWSYLAFGPFLVLGRAALRAFNTTGLSAPWNEVEQGIWLGRRPGLDDLDAYRGQVRAVAVLDLTAEVARSRSLTGAEAYLTLPVLDNAAPTPLQLDAAVAFIEQHRTDGPVYVHCALGLGRGATAVAAWLLATGRCASVDEAEAWLRERRREVGMSRAQRRALAAWASSASATASASGGAR
jgi:protein-tyrosine phosphatase